MTYNKMTPRSNRIDGRIDKSAESLAKRGRTFHCTVCEMHNWGGYSEDLIPLRLDPNQVIGDNLVGLFHKGFIGHRVEIRMTDTCQLPACGCTGEAHA